MKHRMRYCKDIDQPMLQMLNKAGIKYQIYPDIDSVIFYIAFDDPSFAEIDDYVTHRVLGTEMPETLYTPKELNQASWLMMQPFSMKGKTDYLNSDKEFAGSFTYLHNREHMVQGQDLVLASEVKWSKTICFTLTDDGTDIILTNTRVKELAEEHGLRGLGFRTVRRRSGKPCKDTLQLIADHTITAEQMVWDEDAYRKVCPTCGHLQCWLDDRKPFLARIYQDALPADADICIGEWVYGEGIPTQLNFVSQRFYQVMKAHDVARWVKFSPVILETRG